MGEVMLMTLVLGDLPLLWLLLWWWNEVWYAVPVKFWLSGTGTKPPPGNMGLPCVGETFSFLWYFKIVRRPDDFIQKKRQNYGDGVALYRTHLFGSPSIIARLPSVSKFVFQSEDKFTLEWPTADLVGHTSVVAVQGKAHFRLRSFVSNAINSPDALRRIATLVQPRMGAALESWAQTGRTKAYKEAGKVTFENIEQLFVSFEPGPMLDTLDELFHGLVRGVGAYPLKFPGSAFYKALQCRKRLENVFRAEIERKKNRKGTRATNDLMDGLMQIRDDEGNQLSDQEVLDSIVSLVTAG